MKKVKLFFKYASGEYKVNSIHEIDADKVSQYVGSGALIATEKHSEKSKKAEREAKEAAAKAKREQEEADEAKAKADKEQAEADKAAAEAKAKKDALGNDKKLNYGANK